jgi:hypothetical protein
MVSTAPYAKLAAETQQQAVKTLESGFEFASKILDLQKKYVLGVAGLIVAATPTAPSE